MHTSGGLNNNGGNNDNYISQWTPTIINNVDINNDKSRVVGNRTTTEHLSSGSINNSSSINDNYTSQSTLA